MSRLLRYDRAKQLLLMRLGMGAAPVNPWLWGALIGAKSQAICLKVHE
jgi:hypothetical protein